MDFLIGILIGILISSAVSSACFVMGCIMFSKTKWLNFYTQGLLYSLLIAVISFMCLIYIKAG